MSAKEVVAQIKDGMTIGIGGWGPRRKPMALVRELLRSDVKDLTVVAYGGADVGMLCAAGKVKKVVFAFVSLDNIPLEPLRGLAARHPFPRRDRDPCDAHRTPRPAKPGTSPGNTRTPGRTRQVGRGRRVLPGWPQERER